MKTLLSLYDLFCMVPEIKDVAGEYGDNYSEITRVFNSNVDMDLQIIHLNDDEWEFVDEESAHKYLKDIKYRDFKRAGLNDY